MKTTTSRRFLKSIPQLLALASLAAFACSASAAEPVDLARYTFLRSSQNRLASVAGTAHVTAADWSAGAGLKASEIGPAGPADNYFVKGSASTDATTETAARDNNAWLAFSITVDEDWTAALAQFSATLWLDWDNVATARSSTWQLAVSTSEAGPFVNLGVPVSIATVVNTAASSVPVSLTADLSGSPYASLTGGTLWFRIYEWDNSGGTAYINRITNVSLTGTVTSAIPEPSTCALLLGVAGLLVASRFLRKQTA